MRIAIFTDAFVPQINGVVTAIFNLVKGLADNGHEVYIVAPKYMKIYKEFKYPGIKIFRIPSAPAFFYPDFRVTLPFNLPVFRFLKENGIDIIHFETPLTVGLTGITIAKMLKVPIVGTFHTFFADPQYLKHGFATSKVFQKIAWEYSNLFYNRCHLVTSPSDFTRRDLIKHGCTKPVKVISNGIDFNIFDNSKAFEFKTKYNAKGPLLLFVGRVAYEKNIEYLVDCMSFVFKERPDAKLLIVGDGPQFADTKKYIKDAKLSKNIIMLGRVEHADLVKSGIFGAVELFVTASETENQPMTILEAQGNGIPTIGLTEKGIPDLVIDGKNGFVVPNHNKKAFADAVLKVINNKHLHRKLREGTIAEVKHHSLPEVIATWEKTYADLIKKNQKELARKSKK
ncbi:glycosyltransferase [Candidatus Woesearchaeota archaeon]|nr:glycosyltransferase [Candidatus Woesearchaeota archaeon]